MILIIFLSITTNTADESGSVLGKNYSPVKAETG